MLPTKSELISLVVFENLLCGSDKNIEQLQIKCVHCSSESHFLRADLSVEKCCV